MKTEKATTQRGWFPTHAALPVERLPSERYRRKELQGPVVPVLAHSGYSELDRNILEIPPGAIVRMSRVLLIICNYAFFFMFSHRDRPRRPAQ